MLGLHNLIIRLNCKSFCFNHCLVRVTVKVACLTDLQHQQYINSIYWDTNHNAFSLGVFITQGFHRHTFTRNGYDGPYTGIGTNTYYADTSSYGIRKGSLEFGNMEIPFIGTHKILPVNSDSISLPQRATQVPRKLPSLTPVPRRSPKNTDT